MGIQLGSIVAIIDVVSQSLRSNTAEVLSLAAREAVLVRGFHDTNLLLLFTMVNRRADVRELATGPSSHAGFILVSKALTEGKHI
jgi:hypothetical protein